LQTFFCHTSQSTDHSTQNWYTRLVKRPQLPTLFSSHSVVHSLISSVPLSLYFYRVQGYLAFLNTAHQCCVVAFLNTAHQCCVAPVTTKWIHSTLMRAGHFYDNTLHWCWILLFRAPVPGRG
jgi:hypothetical protein